ncbi:MAG: hypothetical protein WCO83_02455 [Alphaproteobacteria bacterium]
MTSLLALKSAINKAGRVRNEAIAEASRTAPNYDAFMVAYDGAVKAYNEACARALADIDAIGDEIKAIDDRIEERQNDADEIAVRAFDRRNAEARREASRIFCEQVLHIEAIGVMVLETLDAIDTRTDARQEKLNANLASEVRAEAAKAAKDHEEKTLRAYPQIGVLGHGKRRQYYFTKGTDHFVMRHSLDDLVAVIEGRE